MNEREIFSEALQRPADGHARIKSPLARVNHDTVRRAPHGLGDEIGKQAIGRISEREICDILHVDRIHLDRNSDSVQLSRDHRRKDRHGLPG